MKMCKILAIRCSSLSFTPRASFSGVGTCSKKKFLDLDFFYRFFIF